MENIENVLKKHQCRQWCPELAVMGERGHSSMSKSSSMLKAMGERGHSSQSESSCPLLVVMGSLERVVSILKLEE
jgi:hypothetical protein